LTVVKKLHSGVNLWRLQLDNPSNFAINTFVISFTAALVYISTFRNRRALLITETELKVMAAAAIIGLNSKPNDG